MLSFPNAKINIGLNIVSKRSDGYHNLESCFYPIPWCDALEIIPSEKLLFSSSGLDIPGSRESNLCLKAFHLLQDEYNIPNVSIHLHKVIPMGAGLGGGSADGAFTLMALDQIFELYLGNEKLKNLAKQLGSDCPFFIENKASFVSETGDELSEIDIHLKSKFLILKNPNIHISTKDAFSNITPKANSIDLRHVLKQPLQSWKSKVSNDFEGSVFPIHPSIEDIKNSFYSLGAIYASMTGTGSTVYGIFDTPPEIEGTQCFPL